MQKFTGVGRGLLMKSAPDPEVGKVQESEDEKKSPPLSPLVFTDVNDGDEIGRHEDVVVDPICPSQGLDLCDEMNAGIGQDEVCGLKGEGKDSESSEKREKEGAGQVKVDNQSDVKEAVNDVAKEEDPQEASPEVPSNQITSSNADLAREPSSSSSGEVDRDIGSSGTTNAPDPDSSVAVPPDSETTLQPKESDFMGEEKKEEASTTKTQGEKVTVTDAATAKVKTSAVITTTTSTTRSSPEKGLLPSPTAKKHGKGILGPAPSAPLVPLGPPTVFPNGVPINIPPPPTTLRLPMPKVMPKNSEEIRQVLQDFGFSLSEDKAAGKMKTSGDTKGKPSSQQPTLQQARAPQHKHPSRPNHPSSNHPSLNQRPNNRGDAQASPQALPQREVNSRWQRSEGKGQNAPHQQRGQQQSRQTNTGPKKSAIPPPTKPGLSSLTKDELEKEYQWHKFNVERKVKKILQTIKAASSSEDVAKELLGIIRTNPSKLANFPWPKEQYVVLEKLIEHAVNAKNDQAHMHQRVSKLINMLQDMHPQGFKEDFRNAMLHIQEEAIQATSAEFRRKLAKSAASFLGELYLLSRASSQEFKASVQSVVTPTVRDWIKSPTVTEVGEDELLLLEVQTGCLESFLLLTLREEDESLRKQVSLWLKEEILNGSRPHEARALLIDVLLTLGCKRPPENNIGQEKTTPSKARNDTAGTRTPTTHQIDSRLSQQSTQHSLQQQGMQRDTQQKQQSQPLHVAMSPPQQQTPHPVVQHLGAPPPTNPPHSVHPGGIEMHHGVPVWPAVSQSQQQQQSTLQAVVSSMGVTQQNQPTMVGYHPGVQTSQVANALSHSQLPRGGVPSQGASDVGAAVQLMRNTPSGGMPTHLVPSGNVLPQASAAFSPHPANVMTSSMMQSVVPHQSGMVSSAPQMMTSMGIQHVVPPGSTHMIQPSPGLPMEVPNMQGSSFLRTTMVSPPQPLQQMNSSGTYQQPAGHTAPTEQLNIAGTSSWQQSSTGIPQHTSVSGLPSPAEAQLMIKRGASQAGQSVVLPHASQEQVSGSASFSQSAASGMFIQSNMYNPSPQNQGMQEGSIDSRLGLGQWGSASPGLPWGEKPQSSSGYSISTQQLATQAFSPPEQNSSQWSTDDQNVPSPELASKTPPKASSGWGDVSPVLPGSSQQRLGTDGWGSSVQAKNVSDWVKEHNPHEWGAAPKSFPEQSTTSTKSVSNHHGQIDLTSYGPRGLHNQQRKPSKSPGSNLSSEHDNYPFDKSPGFGGGYGSTSRPGAYTLPSKHKEGSPAAEGVSYSAMSELGSYGIDAGNEYGGGYDAIGNGGGYADPLSPPGQHVGNFAYMPENRSHQSPSPEHFEIDAIRQCFHEDEQASIQEVGPHQKELRRMREQDQPNWSQFSSSSDKPTSKGHTAAEPRGGRRGYGRGSLLEMTPRAVPSMSGSHHPGKYKQRYSPRK
ncbi:uncharacterized protein [Diadema setosum]|uniref:uncharacterized protein n=1 Tax=Diadema setosum TaxID=31175 RepID=UPI003B3B4E2C